MTKFVDFEEVKATVTFGQAINLLSLQMKQHGQQWRGPCPACKKGGDRALVVTEGKGFFCFSSHKGGDVIALAAHVQECSVKDAAAFLSKATVPNTVPKKEVEDAHVLEPLKYLEHEHDAVKAIGLDTELAKQIGVGYAPKGLMRGTVAWPIRDENGALLGYIGTEADVRLPPDFTTNVVRLKRA
jgi:hypothetical protein